MRHSLETKKSQMKNIKTQQHDNASSSALVKQTIKQAISQQSVTIHKQISLRFVVGIVACI